MKLDILLTILIGIAALIGIYRQWTRLEDKVHMQGMRIEKLEQASRLRMPYEAMEKILNGMAALDALKREKELESDFIENAQAWLTQAMATGTKRGE